MINELNIDKILQRQENGKIYLIHIITTAQLLSLQIQDKMKGDIWAAEFTLERIQELTLKAKNPKKYPVFIKMLMSSMLGQTQSVICEILTYSQLQRKMNLGNKVRNIQNNNKYLILTYISEFDKAHYPLALVYQENPSLDRLKITVKRLAQQLMLNGQEKGIAYQTTDSSMLKYENQTLKTKIKSLEQRIIFLTQNGQNQIDRSTVHHELNQIKKDLQLSKSQLLSKERQIEELKARVKQLSFQIQSKQAIINDLKKDLINCKQNRKEKEKQQQLQTYALLEQKINQMNKQTEQLISELQFAKQKQKKSIFKIQNLENQLQKIILIQKQSKNNYQFKQPNHLSSSRKTPSQKSFKSKKSHQSNKSSNSKNNQGLQTYLVKHKQPNNIAKQTTKRSSVYDSDTQSSKLRKANNSKVSPFRQTSKPLCNQSNSNKTASNNFTTTTMNRFDRNILKNNRDRSRSRSNSRSAKRQNSPPAQIPTDNFASSSQDQRNITEALTKLQERKNRMKNNDSSKHYPKEKSKKDVMGPLQRKITNIAQMLRKAKSRQGRD